jgi:hypothetical protein
MLPQLAPESRSQKVAKTASLILTCNIPLDFSIVFLTQIIEAMLLLTPTLLALSRVPTILADVRFLFTFD